MAWVTLLRAARTDARRFQTVKSSDFRDATTDVHRSIGQIKHQLDATLCRFYFCRVTLHVSGVKRPSPGVLKTGTAATGTCVIVAGKSSHHHIRDEVPNMVLEAESTPGPQCDRKDYVNEKFQ